MVKKICCIFLAISLLLASVPAYPEEILYLDYLMGDVKKNNPEILAAKKRWEASLQRIKLSKALEPPSIGIGFERIPQGSLRFDKTMPDDRSISFSQALPLFGKLSLKEKVAFIESQIYASEYQNTGFEVVKKVKTAYYKLFLADKEIELTQDILGLLKTVAGIAQAGYITGAVSQDKILKLNLETVELNNRIQNLEKEKSATKALINSLLNKPAESFLGEPVVSEDVSFNMDIDTLYRLTLENKPELRIFSYAIEKSIGIKNLTQRSFFPDLMAQLSLRGITAGGIGPWDIMLAFTMPFWFWTKKEYEIKEAIINVEEAKLMYEAMKQKALAETKEEAVKVEIAKNKAELYKKYVAELLETTVNSSIAGFKSGKTDIMVVLDNIRMMVDKKMEYYHSLVEYRISLADLEYCCGVPLEGKAI